VARKVSGRQRGFAKGAGGGRGAERQTETACSLRVSAVLPQILKLPGGLGTGTQEEGTGTYSTVLF